MKWLLVLVIAGCNTSSDVFNTVGNEAARRGARLWPARHAPIGRRAGQEPLHRLENRHGAVAFFALLKLLAIAPLSFAIPATAAGG
jgi:hypothetical protein